MKKILALLLTLTMILSLVACGKEKAPTGNDNKNTASGQENKQEEKKNEEKNKDEKSDDEESWDELLAELDDALNDLGIDTSDIKDEEPKVVDITGLTLADANVDNYAQLIKREFGIDMSEEDGWKVAWGNMSIIYRGFLDGLMIETIYKGDDILGLMQTYFDRCSAVAQDGIWEYMAADMCDKRELTEEDHITFDEAFNDWTHYPEEIGERCEIRWGYRYNDKMVIFQLERNAASSVKLYINFQGEIEE